MSVKLLQPFVPKLDALRSVKTEPDLDIDTDELWLDFPSDDQILLALPTLLRKLAVSHVEADLEPPQAKLETGDKPDKPDRLSSVIKDLAKPLAGHERLVHLTRPTTYDRRVFARADVPYAARWELERIRQNLGAEWTSADFDAATRLTGSTADLMPKLDSIAAKIFGSPHLTSTAGQDERAGEDAVEKMQGMWAEMDREELSMRRNDDSGLGGNADGWYGGRITYAMSLHISKDSSNSQTKLPPGEQFSLAAKRNVCASLLPAEMQGGSFNLARRFGSRRVLWLRLANFSMDDKRLLYRFLIGRIFVVFGRPFRALAVRSDGDSVVCVETNDNVDMKHRREWEPQMPAFHEIIEMYNTLEAKPNQLICKWASRQLYMSETVPIEYLSPEEVLVLPDIVAPPPEGESAVDPKYDLSDGCGYMDLSLAKACVNDNGHIPSAVQFRLGSIKGMVVKMTDEQRKIYPGKRLVVRESMVKGKPAPKHMRERAVGMFECIRRSSLRVGTHLSSEAIVIMNNNGVPTSVFVRRLTQALEELQTKFSPVPTANETRDVHVVPRILENCWKEGVRTIRQRREARLKGRPNEDVCHTSKATRFDGEDECGYYARSCGEDTVPIKELYEVDPISHLPGLAIEAVHTALQAGRDPLKSSFLTAKLHKLMFSLTEQPIQGLRVPVPQSLSGYAVYYHKYLKPHQIICSFDDPATTPIDSRTGRPRHFLEGPVLVHRSPCKLPTDVQKMVAVRPPPELSEHQGCIFFSADIKTCKRSPMSLISGGDYDGDCVTVTWDPEIVEPFQNAPEELADVPKACIDALFDKDETTCRDLLRAMKTTGSDEETLISNMQRHSLAPLKTDLSIPTYAELHQNAVYRLGASDPTSRLMAHVVNTCLDGAKQGLQIRPAIMAKHKKALGGWLDWRGYKKGKSNNNEQKSVPRTHEAGAFILDSIMNAGLSKRNEIMTAFPPEAADIEGRMHDHRALSNHGYRIIESAKRNNDKLRLADVQKLEEHVSICYEIYRAIKRGRHFQQPVIMAYDRYAQTKAFQGVNVSLPLPDAHTHAPLSPEQEKKKKRLLCIRQGQIRALARVWVTKLDMSSIPNLCDSQVDFDFRRLLVGCAAGWIAKQPNGQWEKAKQTFTDEMDHLTTCMVIAQDSGQLLAGVSLPVVRRLRPIN